MGGHVAFSEEDDDDCNSIIRAEHVEETSDCLGLGHTVA
jgi:hypothetical protein